MYYTLLCIFANNIETFFFKPNFVRPQKKHSNWILKGNFTLSYRSKHAGPIVELRLDPRPKTIVTMSLLSFWALSKSQKGLGLHLIRYSPKGSYISIENFEINIKKVSTLLCWDWYMQSIVAQWKFYKNGISITLQTVLTACTIIWCDIIHQ